MNIDGESSPLLSLSGKTGDPTLQPEHLGADPPDKKEPGLGAAGCVEYLNRRHLRIESPERQATSSELFALENLAQPPKEGQKPKRRNFARAIKKALQALRRFEPLPDAAGPIANLLLEFSYASERTYAYVRHQKNFCAILDKDKGEISRSLEWMVEKRIIVRAGGYYAFHAGLFLRLNEWQNPDQMALELKLERPDCQPFFPREINLNDEEVEAMLSLVDPPSTEDTPVDPASTARTPVDPPSTPVDPPSTRLARETREVHALRAPLAAAVHQVMSRTGLAVDPPSTAAQLARASVPSTSSEKLAGQPMELTDALKDQWPRTHDGAIAFLQALNAIEGRNALAVPKWAAAWNKKALDDPGYIVNVLRRRLRSVLDRGKPIDSPLGLAFKIAKHARKL